MNPADITHIFTVAALSNGTNSPGMIKVLELTENGDFDRLSPETICGLLRFVGFATAKQAEKSGHLKRDRDGQIESMKHQGLTREIAALSRLAGLLNFSPALEAMIDNGLDRLKASLIGNLPAGTPDIESHWQSLKHKQRRQHLEGLHHQLTSTFNRSALGFLSADIKYKRLPSNIMAHFLFDKDPEKNADSHPAMEIDPRHITLSSGADMAGIMAHETIHSTLRQLGHMALHKQIAADHPLYNDARLMATRIQTDSYLPLWMGDAHFADLEERMAYKHKAFSASLVSP